MCIIRCRPRRYAVDLVVLRLIDQPSLQDTLLLLSPRIVRIQMPQQASERVNMGELATAPQAPRATEENGKERQDEERGIDVGDEEGLRVGVIGENGLYLFLAVRIRLFH